MNLKMMLAASAMAFLAAGGARAADAVVEEPPPQWRFHCSRGPGAMPVSRAATPGQISASTGPSLQSTTSTAVCSAAMSAITGSQDAWVFGAEADFNGLWNDQNFAGPFPTSVDIGTDWLASNSGPCRLRSRSHAYLCDGRRRLDRGNDRHQLRRRGDAQRQRYFRRVDARRRRRIRLRRQLDRAR